MVRLVPVAQAAQDLDGVVHGRLVHLDLLEAPLEGGVALEVLAVLVERRRADRLQLTARQRRLEDGGRVDGALGRARADEVVQLVDEEDDVAALGDLLHHLLQALLELSAVLRARDQRREVERVDLLALQELGHLVRRDPGREALDDGGLADAGLADQHRVVLRAPRQDLHDALDLRLAADDRVELPLGGELRQVAAELVEELRALRLLAGGAARAGLAAAGTGEHPDDLVADLFRIRVEVEQDPCGDSLVLAHEPEQDVLGADVVVAERERLAQRQLEHLLRAGRERNLAGGDLVALPDDARHLGADLLDGDVEALEHARGEPFLLAEEPEQDVLGPDVVVLQGARLVLGENHDLTCAFSESFEQRSDPLPVVPPDPWYRRGRGVPSGHESPIGRKQQERQSSSRLGSRRVRGDRDRAPSAVLARPERAASKRPDARAFATVCSPSRSSWTALRSRPVSGSAATGRSMLGSKGPPPRSSRSASSSRPTTTTRPSSRPSATTRSSGPRSDGGGVSGRSGRPL